MIWNILGSLIGGFLLSCLIRKYGSHTLLNGFMSKEQADEIFPDWKKTKKDTNRDN